MQRITLLIALSCLLNGCGGGTSSTPEPEARQGATPATTAGETAQPTPADPAVNYDDLIRTADEHIQKLDLNSAVRLLTQAISAEPTRPDAYVRRAAILAEAKHLPQAIKDLSSAIHVEPNSYKLRNTRGYFHLLLKQYEQAEKDFNAAIDRNREYPQAYNNRGLVFIAREKQVPAMNDFKIAIELKPDYVDAHNNLGFVLMQMDQIDEAVAAFTKAIELDQNYINSWSNRGRAYLKQQQHDKAVADFTRAIEIQPDGLQYYLHRSEALKAAGREDEALQDLSYVTWARELGQHHQRVARNPNNADVWVARGRHLLLRDRTDEALESFEGALRVDAEHAPASIARAAIFLQRGDYEKVIADCTKVIDVRPLHEAYSLRGDAYFEQGRYDEAIADYEATRRFDSQVTQAYRLRAEQRQAAGQAEQAAADLEHALALEKRLSEKVAKDAAAPREMVIERTAFESDAAKETK